MYQVGGPWYNQSAGRRFLLSDLCIKGNFSIYNDFMSYVCKNNNKEITNCGLTLQGIFGMICLFLKHNLMDSYVHHNGLDGLCTTTSS